MQKHDRFFIIIVAGVVVLIVVALVIMFTSNASEYKDDSTPEGAAQNYLLAIQKEDYIRAYNYLSSQISEYPTTLNEFISQLGDRGYSVNSRKEIVFSVESVEEAGSEWEVTFTGIRSSGDSLLGGDQFFNRFTVTVVKESEQWKVKDCSYYLFFSFWWIRT